MVQVGTMGKGKVKGIKEMRRYEERYVGAGHLVYTQRVGSSKLSARTSKSEVETAL